MRLFAILIAVVIWACPALGQQTPPAGHVRVEAAGRAVILPADLADAAPDILESIQPPELPTTMPADLTARLRSRRQTIVDRLARDLLLDNRQPIETFYDDRLLPAIQRYEAFQPSITYFWSSRDLVKEALKSGWSHPQFYYNRAADEVMIRARLDLDLTAPDASLLLPALYDADATPDQRRAILTTAIQDAEHGLAGELANRAQLQVHTEFAGFIDETLASALDQPDQRWLRFGLAGALAANYASIATDIEPIAFVRVVASDPPRTPIHARGVDLLDPTPESDLREQYVQPYRQAMRRKSTAIIFDWITQTDETAVPDTLQAIRNRNPKDGDAIVAIIKEISDVDLTEKLKPF